MLLFVTYEFSTVYIVYWWDLVLKCGLLCPKMGSIYELLFVCLFVTLDNKLSLSHRGPPPYICIK